MAESNSITVYGLASSSDGVIRYIGQSSTSLATRLKRHITWTVRKRDKSRRTAWITSVLAAGHKLEIIGLELGAVKNEAEIKWIARYREAGSDLVNGSLGGDGCIGVPKTEEHKARIAAAHKGSKKPWTSVRNSLAKGLPGHPSTPETNAKIAAAHKGKIKPWVAERNKNVPFTAEMKLKGRATRLARGTAKLSDDDVRAIKFLLADGMTQTSVACMFDVSISLVSKIDRGVRYADIT